MLGRMIFGHCNSGLRWLSLNCWWREGNLLVLCQTSWLGSHVHTICTYIYIYTCIYVYTYMYLIVFTYIRFVSALGRTVCAIVAIFGISGCNPFSFVQSAGHDRCNRYNLMTHLAQAWGPEQLLIVESDCMDLFKGVLFPLFYHGGLS